MSANEDASPVSIDTTGLDPLVLSLGQLLGLLTVDGDSVTLVSDWFSEPLTKTRDAATNNPDALISVITQLLGEVGGNALGIPVEDPNLLGTWYPIQWDNKPTGAYVVAYTPADSEETRVIGLGARVTWTSTVSGDVPEGSAAGVLAQIWGMAPLISLGGGAFDVALATQGRPLSVGASLTGADGADLFDGIGISLAGVRATGTLDVANTSDPLNFTMVFANLLTPDATKARDVSLADLEALTADQILEIVSALAVSALSEATGGDARLNYLLPALGLATVVPQVNTPIPLLGWAEMAALVTSGGNPIQPFLTWFLALVSDNNVAAAWLSAVAGVINGAPPAVTGSGTREDPLKIPVFTTASAGTLNVTLASETDEAGTRMLYPGLWYAGPAATVSDALVLVVNASLELVQLNLSSTGQVSSAGPSSLQGRAALTMRNPDASTPLFSGTVLGQTYTFGSLVMGLDLAPGLQMMPACLMVDVVSPNGKYAVLDFTQPEQIAQVALQELIDAIVAQLSSILGLSTNPDDPFGQPVGALVGLIPPRVPDGVTWPAELAPPLSAAALLNTVKNPVASLSEYYFSLLSTTVGGNLAFVYMLSELGSLLAMVGAPSVAVHGTGSMTDPWRVSLVDADLAGLIAWRDSGDGPPTTLTFGLDLLSTVPILDSNTLRLEFALDVMQLVFTSDGHPGLGSWLPRLGFNASLPEPLASPEVAGAYVSVAQTVASFNWFASTGWTWNMQSNAPVLTVGTDEYPIGENLEFSDTAALDALVTVSGATFAPLLVRLMGLFALRTDWPAAYALDGILGLLPNLGPSLPTEIAWPSDMPVLTPTGFTDPVGDITGQISAIAANPAYLAAAARLLAWSLSTSGVVPPVPGDGTLESPLQVPLGLPLSLRLWAGANASLGLGLGRTDRTILYGMIVDTDVTVRGVELALGGAGAGAGSIPVPSVSIQVTVSAQSGSLGTATNGSPILSLTAGVILSLDGGAITADPITLISLGGDQPEVLDAASLSADQLTYESLNLAFQAVASALATDSTFITTYRVLTDLGLVLARPDTDSPYGVNPSGWSGLISDPTTWLTVQTLTTLAVPDERAALLGLLANMLGREAPIALPSQLANLFFALGFVTGPETGYTILPEAVIELSSAPITTLVARADALLNDPVVLALLISQLAGSTGMLPLGPFTWGVVNGTIVEIGVPEANAVVIGGIVNLSGSIQIDLRNGTLKSATRAFIPTVGVAAQPALSWSLANPTAPDFTVNLTWGSDKTPSAQALTLFPFNQDTFITQITEIGPTQALSTFVTMILDPYVLQPYPLAQALLMPLGLVVLAEDQSWHLKSLLGLFDDPLDWFLSDAVIGLDGQLNISAVAVMLAGIPSAAVSGGIYIENLGKQAGLAGVELGGLPYGVSFTMSVDSACTLVSFAGAISGLEIGGSTTVATLDLNVGLTLDASYQPGITGLVTARESTTQVGASAGYNNDGFLLNILSPGDGPSLTLVPFAGWQTLAQVLAQAASLVVQSLTSTLLDQLALDPDTAPFVTSLRLAASPDELDVPSLVTALSTATTTQEVLDAALNWLSTRLSPTGAPGSVAAIITLLSPYIDGLSADVGLLAFVPSSSLPLTLLIGRDTAGLLGLWAELDLPTTGVVQIQVQRTGVGFQTTSDWPVTFSFGLSLLAPIVDATTGPSLSLAFDVSSGRVQMFLDPQQSAGAASAMNVELLPSFFGNQPDGVESWLVDVLTQVLPRYASIVVLNLAPVAQWLNTPIVATLSSSGAAAPTPGDLFVGGQIILREPPDNTYVLNSLDALLALAPNTFIAGFLKALLAEDIKVFAIGDNGGIFLANGGQLGYGVRLYAPDISLPQLPEVTFQIGADDTGWIADSGGPSQLQPGVGVFIPIPADTPEYNQTTLALVNIGLDVHGADQGPLVQLSRFELGQVSPRFLGLFNFSDLSGATIGGALSVEKMGFAVAPNSLSSGPNLNPIAANMLGSGSPSSETSNPPTDPTLSARVAYVSELSAGFIDANGNLTDEVILQVQQSFGPLSVQQIGLGWDNTNEILSFLFSGGLDVGPLAMQVVDLSVSLPVTDPTNYDGYSLDLAGLAVSFTTSSVVIAGALLKYSDPTLRYDGVVLLKVGTFSLTAAGSYTTVMEDPPNANPHSPSFFVFAASGTPIGGPPAFFVRGLSAGFGYNRALRLPTAAEIPDYLLVQGSLDPSAVFGDDPTPAGALEKLSKDVLPSVGSYWLAAGVHFTTYALLDSVGLLVVTFGDNFSLGLLGVSRLTLPPLVSSPSSALLYVELGLSVTIQPSLGLVAATAQLTPNSFVLDKACKLTGGFAFYLWWSPNAHAGDFVLTVGGYNANYTAPDYYPTVPRLGISWPLTSPVGSISIVGNAYFALTPNAIMCGGLLDLQFSAGPLAAWFTASADFLIAWKPFYYDIRIEISIGVSFTATLFGVTVTLTAELGAGLELWGPPTAGKAHISWYVISFSIPIGDQDKDLDTQTIADWDTFAANFLPVPGVSQPPAQGASFALDSVSQNGSVAEDDSPQQNVLTLAIPEGQITQPSAGQHGSVAPADPSVWTINRIGFTFTAQTPIPVSTAVASTLTPLTGVTDVGVRPMAVSDLASQLTFTLTPQGSGTPLTLSADSFQLTPSNAGAPMALWDAAQFNNNAAPTTPTVIDGVLLGASLSGTGYLNINPVGPIDLSVFDTEQLSPLDLPLSTDTPYPPADPYPDGDQNNAMAILMATIMDSDVVTTRNTLLAGLRGYALVAPSDPNVSIIATQATNVYQAPPVLARLGQTLAPAVPSATRVTVPAAAAPAPAPTRAPVLVAMTRRYTVPGASNPTKHALRPSAGRTFARPLTSGQLVAARAGGPTLQDGAVAVWSVDPRSNATVSLSGALSALALCFNRSGELCGHHRINAGARNTSRQSLPARTATVALVGDTNAAPLTAGWLRDTPLLRLSERVLLGEGCMVRPQGVVRGRDIGATAVMSAEQMFAASQIRGKAGVRTGWITTLLPAHLDRADIYFAGAADDVEVALVVEQDGRDRREAADVLIREVDGGVVVSVDLRGRAVRGWSRVMVRPTNADQLQGVMGINSAAQGLGKHKTGLGVALATHASHAVLLTSHHAEEARRETGRPVDQRQLRASVAVSAEAQNEVSA